MSARLPCSDGIFSFFYRRAKREVKEILFWSREKHLAASWWEGERSRGGECKEDKSVRERWFISRPIYGFFFLSFFFFWSLRIMHGMLSGMIAVLRQQSWISKWICTFHMAVTLKKKRVCSGETDIVCLRVRLRPRVLVCVCAHMCTRGHWAIPRDGVCSFQRGWISGTWLFRELGEKVSWRCV